MPTYIPAPPDHSRGHRSPFTPSFGSTPPTVEGRQRYVNDFAYALDNGPGSAGRATLVTGQRGVGKSVMLNVFHDIADSRQWVSVHEDASAGFAGRLTNVRLPEAMASLETNWTRGARVSGGSFTALGFGGGITTERDHSNPIIPDFRHQLMKTIEQLETYGTGLLITLDEVHRSNLDELQTITDGISYAFRRGAPIAFAAAGLPETINGLVNSDISTYLRRAARVDLGNLSDADTQAAFEVPAREAGKTFTAEALSAAVTESGNYPYLVQLLGDEAWKHSGENDTITAEDVSSGTQMARSRMYTQIHEPVMETLSTREREFILEMARNEGPTRTSGIAAHMGISPQNAGGLRERLISQGIIEPAGHGHVAFTIPYTRDYLILHASHDRLHHTEAAVNVERSATGHTQDDGEEADATVAAAARAAGMNPAELIEVQQRMAGTHRDSIPGPITGPEGAGESPRTNRDTGTGPAVERGREL